ncbi:hypothetical protein HU200_027263 [Digitaria exilis]|uniref:Uncharacterized protein n=1 Tax=Digitaria exilis TaxID=1010633 RepID=A0A835BW60_9POAL|nr:hypothetical protein HU200_027263 [Digitaria exilis]
MAKKGGAGERKVEAPPLETEGIVWREDAGRFETPDGEAFLQYRLPSPAVMDMVQLCTRICRGASAGRGSRRASATSPSRYSQISDNNLASEKPPEITRLTNLIQLELYNNSLAGFGNLTNLQFLDASQNKLSELRSLKQLVSLQVFFNNFSGGVPPEFGDFKELVNLFCYNSLTGGLP